MPKNEVHVPVNDGECYPVDQATCILQEAAPLWQSHLHTRIHTTTVSLAPYLNLRLRALKTWQEFQVKAAQYNPIMYIIYPLSIYLSLSLCLSVYLSIYLSVYLSICLSVYLSICLSIYLSVCLCLSVYLSVCLSICTCTHIYAHIRTYTYTILYVHIPWICSCKQACIRTLTEWQFAWLLRVAPFAWAAVGLVARPKLAKSTSA